MRRASSRASTSAPLPTQPSPSAMVFLLAYLLTCAAAHPPPSLHGLRHELRTEMTATRSDRFLLAQRARNFVCDKQIFKDQIGKESDGTSTHCFEHCLLSVSARLRALVVFSSTSLLDGQLH